MCPIKQSHRIFLTILAVGLSLSLIGCEDKKTEIYLLQHPLYLKQEYDYCQSLTEMTEDQHRECSIILQAATKVVAISSEEQNHPEELGQRILDAEIACANMLDTVHQAEQTLATLKASRAEDAAAIQAQEMALAKAKIDYEAQRLELTAMMAIVGLSGPE